MQEGSTCMDSYMNRVTVHKRLITETSAGLRFQLSSETGGGEKKEVWSDASSFIIFSTKWVSACEGFRLEC